jgi:1-acyl-sn-glycerol-3-phosphate acyltransferase
MTRTPSPPRRYRVLAWLSRAVVGVLFRPRVTGREHLPQGGFVLSSNHLSGLDVVALGYPLSRRWLRHMAKPQLFSRPRARRRSRERPTSSAPAIRS